MASRLFLRSSFALRPTTAAATPVMRRGFAVSSSHQMKESSGDNNDYDKHKQDSLSKQKAGQGHWKPELASDGEEAVKADRQPDEDFASMQERTKKHAEEKAKHGTSTKDPM